MDEKTEELRDLFVDATGSETVTERQAESPGSLVDRDDDAVADRVAALVATMRERYGFDSDLGDAGYERVVVGFFDGEDDAAIADALGGSGSAVDSGIDARAVRDARLDLHLVADADRDAPFEYAALKRLLAADRSVEAAAAELDADAETVREFVPVARADLASTRVNDRFRDEFRALLTDADIEDAHAATAREDGLREATEDIETDVSL
ncbi:hypothetical protein [Halorubrum cibi]|uniref:Conditioned medium-induced protein 4 n=1 Tax=Halorubrum cibi TaxID=413815 RepID=A0A521CB92_9EURY|nr:hypothetical protein [Halorubrum cibi]SMO56717.1 hypothetical protein SAMN06264867_10463 [Halorubrum cibi]